MLVLPYTFPLFNVYFRSDCLWRAWYFRIFRTNAYISVSISLHLIIEYTKGPVGFGLTQRPPLCVLNNFIYLLAHLLVHLFVTALIFNSAFIGNWICLHYELQSTINTASKELKGSIQAPHRALPVETQPSLHHTSFCTHFSVFTLMKVVYPRTKILLQTINQMNLLS